MQIKKRLTDSVIYEGEYATIRLCVEAAVKSGANLSHANLSGANLYGANLSGAYLSGAYLSHANLYGAYLSHANLYGAYLYGANLSGANLSGANLFGANLSGANLYGAYLSGANLSGATANPLRLSPLYMLRDQPGKIRLYKLVTKDGVGPFNGGIKYEKRKTYTVRDANTDENIDCTAGINVATLDWCLANWKEGYRVLVIEFTAKDIACIPRGTDGKIRLHRCKVVGEKSLDELGLTEEKKQCAEYEKKRAEEKANAA